MQRIQATAIAPISGLNCPSRRQTARYALVSGYPNLANCNNPTDGLGFFHADYRAQRRLGAYRLGYGARGYEFGESRSGLHEDGRLHRRLLSTQSDRAAHIVDGASNTYLIGEKYLNPDQYFTGADYGDDQPALGGDDFDLVAWSDPNENIPPRQDTPGLGLFWVFGSPHAGNFNTAFCDGSIHQISYSIDLETHRRLAARNDRQAVDVSKF